MKDQGLILIMTGGLSRRMGRPKAFLPLHEACKTTFLQRLLQITEGLSPRRAVVSSLSPTELGCELPVVVQERPEEGQLSSLLLAWNTFGEDLDWLMPVLVDHPYVARESLQALLQARREHPQALLWAPSFKKRGGHPVIFSRELVEKLAQTPLELGARPVVRAHAHRRHWVVVDDPAVLWDVDTPEDYDFYSEEFKKLQS